MTKIQNKPINRATIKERSFFRKWYLFYLRVLYQRTADNLFFLIQKIVESFNRKKKVFKSEERF
ncbi:hypothetical protein BpHYR1_013173 [Brachionus plicatilis]|uniref:Uncharacterized protein n=1 Tax=Brachionus plicatilis TaxID=10195 RepID=A0A3M7T3G7_BRAPC|nr:hypothetical protein BpHYR1_013173 [Brachionus plicatilis]